jgi:hypothetical protein
MLRPSNVARAVKIFLVVLVIVVLVIVVLSLIPASVGNVFPIHDLI